MEKILGRARPVAGIVAACCVCAAAAASDGAPIDAARLVVARTQVARLSQPSVLAIHKRDVDQGFIDLPNASSFEVGENGDFVVSAANAPYISLVKVHLSPAEGLAAPGSGDPRSAGQSPRRRFVLSYRIYLSSSASVGLHPWPFEIQASAR